MEDRIRITGVDDEFIFLGVPSMTNPKTLYDVGINRHSGQVFCNCKDAECRIKIPRIDDLISGVNAHSCKHMRAVATAVNQEQQS